MSLSLGNLWSETAGLARRAGWRLFAIAFLLLSLPAAVLRLIAPVTAPGHLPDPGLWLPLVPIVLAASLLGALAISRLALRPAESVGAALAAATRRFLPLLAAALPVAIAAALLAIAAAHLGAIIATPLLSALPMVAFLALLLFLWARLILITPAAAMEPIGPVALISRSWSLTAGNGWRLVALLIAAGIVSLLALVAVGALGGILLGLSSGEPQPGWPATILVLSVSALFQAAISGLVAALVARVYAQLAGDNPPA